MNEPIASWSIVDVKTWIISIGLEQYTSLIELNKINGEVLVTFSESDWKDLGIEFVGHRRIITLELKKKMPQELPPQYEDVIEEHEEKKN